MVFSLYCRQAIKCPFHNDTVECVKKNVKLLQMNQVILFEVWYRGEVHWKKAGNWSLWKQQQELDRRVTRAKWRTSEMKHTDLVWYIIAIIANILRHAQVNKQTLSGKNFVKGRRWSWIEKGNNFEVTKIHVALERMRFKKEQANVSKK